MSEGRSETDAANHPPKRMSRVSVCQAQYGTKKAELPRNCGDSLFVYFVCFVVKKIGFGNKRE